MSEITLRNYVHATDFASVKANLILVQMYDEEWDKESRIAGKSSQSPDSFLVAESDGRVVGSIFVIDDFYPFLFRLNVHPDYRRQGVGERLITEACRRVKAHGFAEVGFFVDETNEHLKKWYEKQGFHGEHVYRSYWKKL
jgi:ribosomal protein S18 acetylase RimI-like enzyme